MNKVDTRWLAFGIFLAAIALRFIPHPYNFTPMAAMALFAGCYLSGHIGFVLAFGAMALSDFIGSRLGFASIHFYNFSTMLAVYVALGMTAVIGRAMRSSVNPATVLLGAISATVLFFVTTNFACWLDPMMGYAQTPAGLAQCYIAAVPFATSTLLGDAFYSALLFGGYALLAQRSELATQPNRVE